MSKRIIFVAVVITLSFGLSAAYGLGDGNEKVGALQKVKNAYNDFRVRQQQKSQAVKNKALKQSLAPKVTASKIKSPKVESPQAVAPKAQAPDKEMSKEEMLAELKEELADNEDVFDMVPELKAGEAADGKVFYTFKGVKLEDLPKEDLNGLFTKVRQAMVRVRTERIQRQLEMVAQAQRPQRIAAPPQPPRTSASSPLPPRVPSKPSAPPSPPSAPPSPPSASQRR